jgi:hypothetical protein
VAGSCEHGNEPSGSIKVGENIDQVSDYQLLKKVSAPCSWLRIVLSVHPLHVLHPFLSVFLYFINLTKTFIFPINCISSLCVLYKPHVN